MNLKLGEKYDIHCFKHDGTIHRTWDEAILLEIHDDYLIFGNNRTKVVESDGRSWKTKEPAVMYFYKNNWFNIIGQYKKDGVYYYCNIASPIKVNENTLQYIDYDLDLRVFPNGKYKILDRGEYNFHRKKMHYSKDLDLILNTELKNLIEKVKRQDEPFQEGIVEKYYKEYLNYKKEKHGK